MENQIGASSRGCPSLVGGRPAKSVVRNGREGSNPSPRAKRLIISVKAFSQTFEGFKPMSMAFCRISLLILTGDWSFSDCKSVSSKESGLQRPHGMRKSLGVKELEQISKYTEPICLTIVEFGAKYGPLLQRANFAEAAKRLLEEILKEANSSN